MITINMTHKLINTEHTMELILIIDIPMEFHLKIEIDLLAITQLKLKIVWQSKLNS